jgi:hypothetical protein
MNCLDLEVLLCDYLDGTLPEGQKTELERHLSACAGCAGLARDAAVAVEFMGRAAAVEPPPELITRILYSLPPARQARARQPGGIRKWFSHLVQPMLQPRFAMGFAMTILSFSMLGRFAGIQLRQLSPKDFNPAAVWQGIDDRLHRAWDRSIKFYESLRVVYEIQSRIREWTEQDQTERKAATPEEPPASSPQNPTGSNGKTNSR